MEKFKIIGERIKELRTSNELTQLQFSKKVGCTTTTLSAYENNLKQPSLSIIMDISKTFNVSLDWLCGLSDKINNSFEFKTYSDVIHVLNSLERSDINLEIVELKDCLLAKNYESIPAIIFDNYDFLSFLWDWENMLGVRDNLVIKENLYDLWIKDQLEQNNSLIRNAPINNSNKDKSSQS